MKGLLTIGLSFGLVACAARPPAPPQELPEGVVRVDEVVAVVDERPITCSEVELEARIHRVSIGDCAVAVGELPQGDLPVILEALIDRTLVLREWGSESSKVGDEQLDADLDRLKESCLTEEAWTRMLSMTELSEVEIRDRRRQTLEAEKLLAQRLSRQWQLRRNQLVKAGDTEDQQLAKRQALLDEMLQGLREPARRVRIIDDLRGSDHC